MVRLNDEFLIFPDEPDKSINLENFDKYIALRPCVSKYFRFLKRIFQKAQYVDKARIVGILEKNIIEIIELIKGGRVPVLISQFNVKKK